MPSGPGAPTPRLKRRRKKVKKSRVPPKGSRWRDDYNWWRGKGDPNHGPKFS